MSHRGAQSQILRFMMQNPGRTITADDIEERLGLPRQTALSSLATLAKKEDSGVTRGAGMGMYSYQSKTQTREPRKTIAVGTLLECVGFTDHGDPVVRDEENVTYIARLTK